MRRWESQDTGFWSFGDKRVRKCQNSNFRKSNQHPLLSLSYSTPVSLSHTQNKTKHYFLYLYKKRNIIRVHKKKKLNQPNRTVLKQPLTLILHHLLLYFQSPARVLLVFFSLNPIRTALSSKQFLGKSGGRGCFNPALVSGPITTAYP